MLTDSNHPATLTVLLVASSIAAATPWSVETISNEGGGTDFSFGQALAADEGRLLAGAPFFVSPSGARTGAAFLIDLATGTQQRIIPGDARAFDRFGLSVDLADGIAAVGSPLDNNTEFDSGSVYLFDATTGAQIRKITPDGALNDNFGEAVAVGDGLIAVGGEDNNVHLLKPDGSEARSLAKRIDEEQRLMERQQQRQRTAEHRETLKGTYEMMLTARREDVKQERRIKEENAEIARQSREFEMQRNREANRAIRQHQKAVHSRFEKQRQAHKEFLAQDFINMISQEDKRREEIEHEIAAMEIDERSHIDRLRALQEEQKSAYDALEAALAS